MVALFIIGDKHRHAEQRRRRLPVRHHDDDRRAHQRQPRGGRRRPTPCAASARPWPRSTSPTPSSTPGACRRSSWSIPELLLVILGLLGCRRPLHRLSSERAHSLPRARRRAAAAQPSAIGRHDCMRRFFARARALHERGVLGINQRNGALVLPLNPRRHYPRVDDKLLTKRLAEAAGIPTPRSLGVITYHHQLRDLPALLDGPRPVRAQAGARRAGQRHRRHHRRSRTTHYRKSSGALLERRRRSASTSRARISGVFSLRGDVDSCLIEERVVLHPAFATIARFGIPDVRVDRLSRPADHGHVPAADGRIGRPRQPAPGRHRRRHRHRQRPRHARGLPQRDGHPPHRHRRADRRLPGAALGRRCCRSPCARPRSAASATSASTSSSTPRTGRCCSSSTRAPAWPSRWPTTKGCCRACAAPTRVRPPSSRHMDAIAARRARAVLSAAAAVRPAPRVARGAAPRRRRAGRSPSPCASAAAPARRSAVRSGAARRTDERSRSATSQVTARGLDGHRRARRRRAARLAARQAEGRAPRRRHLHRAPRTRHSRRCLRSAPLDAPPPALAAVPARRARSSSRARSWCATSSRPTSARCSAAPGNADLMRAIYPGDARAARLGRRRQDAHPRRHPQRQRQAHRHRARLHHLPALRAHSGALRRGHEPEQLDPAASGSSGRRCGRRTAGGR